MIPLDAAWLAANPLPPIEGETDKNQRGRLLVCGGSLSVPGGLLLTGEAGYRAGAGKVQLAMPAAAAVAAGVRLPEAAVFGLQTNDAGELGESPDRLAALLGRCDALILGPGMGKHADVEALLAAVLYSENVPAALLLDAGMIKAARAFEADLRRLETDLLLTPHPGEMAALMGCDPDAVGSGTAQDAAERFGAVVVLKGGETCIAAPGGAMLHYRGGGPGLATGGSGDVLAGAIGGLLARGVTARDAAAWGVWAHGEAGRHAAARFGRIGLLARDILPLLPALLYG